MFIGIILTRLLFVASMVFIIGYVFGNFSKKKSLTAITRVAAILTIVLFIGSNIFLYRGGTWRQGKYHARYECNMYQKDSTISR